MQTEFFRGKNILILSPQPWQGLFISKHNYARALAQHNRVLYIGAPAYQGNGYSLVKPDKALNLEVLEYNVPFPLGKKLKFHWPWLYRFFIRQALQKILRSLFQQIDVCIDFGCYQQYRSIQWIPAKTRIFFPVDDHYFLDAKNRGADLVLSVSENICNKFSAAGQKCHFINHGLNSDFEENAVSILREERFWKRGKKLKAGYSGNLFIPFLDIPVLKRIIEENTEVEFHFFGSTNFNREDAEHVKWDSFLRSTPNVVLHGFLNPGALVEAFSEIDCFLLCYKPDYKNYHAENSHKVFEYLSTGKLLITTYLSIHHGNPLMLMSSKDKNEEMVSIFCDSMQALEMHNTIELQKERIHLSLKNTYSEQIKRIGDLLRNTEN
ncbi:MAG: hypothetical protein IT250_03690 [Chitinophagaceae bacterium]|nr:hypothetical protein [Chitinophagaceae bacterium]